tara:strand:+ start:3525 stop:3794 length:270 start_codon:yes stop_codon:yes gene_type:complete
MNTEDRTTYLHGQIDGLKTLCLALLTNHHDPKSVLESLEMFSQMALSKNAATSAPDLGLEAAQEMISAFRKILEHESNRKPPRTPEALP